MPQNETFSVTMEVDGAKLPEYFRNEKYFVECNLHTPVSYCVDTEEILDGESHTQKWPATPYSITVHHLLISDLPQAYFRIFVDGIKVKSVNLSRGESRTVHGFKEGSSTKEFLFSLPRITTDARTGRLNDQRVPHIGCVRVECWRADLKQAVRQPRLKHLHYMQAGKQDACRVTGGEYAMSTTRVGRLVSEDYPVKLVNHWRRTILLSRLQVQYHMADTLREMGFELKPIPFGSGCCPDALKKEEVKEELPVPHAAGSADACPEVAQGPPPLPETEATDSLRTPEVDCVSPSGGAGGPASATDAPHASDVVCLSPSLSTCAAHPTECIVIDEDADSTKS